VKPTEITDATFETEVLKATLPVVVDFWAPWCGPCKQIAPIVDELAEEYHDKVRFVKLNTDQNQAHASKLGVRGIPTLLFFKGGSEVDRVVGLGHNHKEELKKRLDVVVGPKPAAA
jgi:thioredoxin 1